MDLAPGYVCTYSVQKINAKDEPDRDGNLGDTAGQWSGIITTAVSTVTRT
jgi:hypothetical protein